MQFVELSSGYVTAVDSADYERVSAHKWCAKPGPTRSDGTAVIYAIRSVDRQGGGKTTQGLHRFIMGTPEGMETDHINGNGLDNRKCNLRICTTAENQRNQRAQTGRSSIYKGVTWNKRGSVWAAQMNSRGGTLHLGSFKVETDAARAYNIAAIARYGEFAKVNAISEIG